MVRLARPLHALEAVVAEGVALGLDQVRAAAFGDEGVEPGEGGGEGGDRDAGAGGGGDDGGSDDGGTNTATTGGTGDQSFAGQSFTLHIGPGDWLDDIGGDVSDNVPDFWMSIGGSGSNYQVTMTTAREGAQDMCNKTHTASASSDPYPGFLLGPTDFPLYLKHAVQPVAVQTTAYDLTMTDVLPTGAATTEENSLTAILDAREVLTEVGNILLNACLGVFGDLLQVRFTFAVPRMHLDALGSLLDSLVIGRDEGGAELHHAVLVGRRGCHAGRPVVESVGRESKTEDLAQGDAAEFEGANVADPDVEEMFGIPGVGTAVGRAFHLGQQAVVEDDIVRIQPEITAGGGAA